MLEQPQVVLAMGNLFRTLKFDNPYIRFFLKPGLSQEVKLLQESHDSLLYGVICARELGQGGIVFPAGQVSGRDRG